MAFLLASQAVFSQDAASLYREGVKLKEQNKVSLALEKFKQAVALKPDYPDAYYEMGWCQNDLTKYPEA